MSVRELKMKLTYHAGGHTELPTTAFSDVIMAPSHVQILQSFPFFPSKSGVESQGKEMHAKNLHCKTG